MLKKISRLILVVIIIGLFLIPTPILAVTDQPTDTPTFTHAYVNRSIITTNDVFVYGMYDIPYDTIPAAPASQTYSIQVMNDGETITYGEASPFVYHDKGYNKGIVSFYFSPGTITWGSDLTIRITQVAGEFTSPANTDIGLTITNYINEFTQEANQEELKDNLIEIAQILSNEFDTELLTSSSGVDILSSEGETYFRGAIPGLQTAVPDLFLIQRNIIDTTTRTYTTEQFDSYADRFNDTWVGDAMDAGGDMLGMGGNTFMMFLFTLPLCLGSVIFTSLKFKKTEPGLILASLFMIMSVLMGWMPAALFATIFQLFGIYIGYLLFYARSGDALGHRLLSFTIFCYFISVLICVILEGSYFGADERGIFNGVGFFTTFSLPIIGDIPVLNVGFLESFGRVLTWGYSFYTGSYEILRWFWFGILSAGPAWGLVQFFIGLIPSIISIFRPSIST